LLVRAGAGATALLAALVVDTGAGLATPHARRGGARHHAGSRAPAPGRRHTRGRYHVRRHRASRHSTRRPHALSAPGAPSAPAAASTGGAAGSCSHEHWTVQRWMNNASDVEFSPDGKRIVYWRVASGFGGGNNQKTDIFVADLDSHGNPVHERDLTTDLSGENDVPVWSSDGRKIAFTSSQGNPVDVAGGAGGPGVDLWVMNADGTHKKRLTTSIDGTSFRPRWSRGPGPPKLFYTHTPSAFDSYRWEMVIANFVDDPTGGHLDNAKIINPDATDTAFYEDSDFSLDNRSLYYTGTTANSENYDIYRYDLASGQSTRLTDSPELDESAHISPDGAKLAFISSRDHQSLWGAYLYASDLAGLPPTADTFGVAVNAVVAWNEPVEPQGTDIYMMNPDGSGVTRLTNFPDQVGGGVPNWSPDGCTIAVGAFQYPTYHRHPWIAGTPYPGGVNTEYKIVFR
jgi:hypothetical protein